MQNGYNNYTNLNQVPSEFYDYSPWASLQGPGWGSSPVEEDIREMFSGVTKLNCGTPDTPADSSQFFIINHSIINFCLDQT